MKHENFPCIDDVAVDVTEVVADDDSVEVAVDVTVEVLGYVVTVLVTVVESVVKSHLVYAPLW